MKFRKGQKVGHYQILSKLGAGGMGVVYLAKDLKLERNVALKFLEQSNVRDKDRLARFMREAKATSALNHPNIVTVHEIGESEGVLFIVSEFVTGVTLREMLERETVELERALQIVFEIASALDAAHSAGIAHRDIKPENVMVRSDGYVKVLDFGLAKAFEHNRPAPDPEAKTVTAFRTHPGMILGTVAYMSPEQVRGQEVDSRTDIWSLGALLYELITGRPPFLGETSSDVMASILKEEPPPLSVSMPSVPVGLQEIVDRSLSKATGSRYPDIRRFAEEVYDLGENLRLGVAPNARPKEPGLSTVAILPFRSLSGNDESAFLEFSLADAVITELARLRSLAVTPSSVVARYVGSEVDPLEVGKELKAGVVLTANFLAAGNKVRVTCQLVNVFNGRLIWVERIDADAEDIITLQDTISRRIVEGLEVEFSASEESEFKKKATSSAEAYVEYLQGRDRLRRYVNQTVSDADMEAAVLHFNKAIELDPGFGLAYCALGGCHLQKLFKGMGNYQDIKLAEQALRKGLELDPGNVEAKAYLAFVFSRNGQREDARELLVRLRADSPKNPLVHFASAVFRRNEGEYEEAMNDWDAVLRLDPTTKVIVFINKARIYIYQGKFKAAMSELDKAFTMEPEHPLVLLFYAVGVFRSGEAEKASLLIRELMERHPRPAFRPYLSMCLSEMGRRAEAAELIDEEVLRLAATDADVAYWLASAFAMLEKRDEAIEWLRKSMALGNRNRRWFEANPSWSRYFDDAGFLALMREASNPSQ